MFFFPTDTLVQEYVEMVKQKAILLEDVPHYLNLKQCVELELKRQDIIYDIYKSKDKTKGGIGLSSFFR